MHRDLKPENVGRFNYIRFRLSLSIYTIQVLYRNPPGQNGAGHDDCVVSDFGLAVQIQPGQKLHVVAGSAGYSAPEMYSSAGYGLPVDCWSLG